MKVAGFKDPQSYSLPVLIAVGLHLVLLIVMSTQWIASQEVPRVKPIKAISAKVIQVENQQAKKRNEDKIRKQKQAKKRADKKRKDDARKKADRKKKLDKKRAADKKAKALAAKKAADKKAAKKKADAKRKADLKKKADAKRQAADKKRAAEAEKQRQEVLASEARQQAAQEALDAALQEELVAEQASADQAAVNDYANAIRLQIMRFWVTPPSARRADKLKLRLQLLPTGDVAAVTVTEVSGNSALDRSAEQAVHRAKPFTVPKDALLFEKMRVINIEMSPENLRW